MSVYEQAQAELRGLVLNMPVPFVPGTYEIDRAGLRENIEFWIDRGVKVIMITIGTSDFFSLSDDEIRDVTSITVEAAAKRVHVMACTSTWWLGQVSWVGRVFFRSGISKLPSSRWMHRSGIHSVRRGGISYMLMSKLCSCGIRSPNDLGLQISDVKTPFSHSHI